MGFLKDAIEAIDPAPSKKSELTLALQTLFELAEQRRKSFEMELKNSLRTAGTSENPTIPITEITGSIGDTRAYVEDDASTLPTIVTGAVKKFIGGTADGITDGIGELVTGALSAILGSGSGTQAEFTAYYIFVDSLSIVRMDVAAWSRRIEVDGITTKIENAVAYQAIKSSVDVNKITFNTFLGAYKVQLDHLNLEPSRLKELIVEAKEIFELLRDSNARESSANRLQVLQPPAQTRALR